MATNIAQHAMSVSLKCVEERSLRCESVFKTNGLLYKYLKLGVSPNLLKVLIYP